QTNCVSTPPILLRNRSLNISCKIFRRCSSRFFAKLATLTETARLILSIRQAQGLRTARGFRPITRDEEREIAHRKRFDGRDGRAKGCALWRIDPACGLKFSDQRLPVQPAVYSRARSDQMGGRTSQP